MSDIALSWSADAFAADLVVEANDLKRDDGLRTAVILSLFTDRRAEDGDPLPDGYTDRRGFWADAVPVVPDDKFGSHLWLRARSKQTADLPALLEGDARAALKWLLDDKVASAVDVTAEFLKSPRGYVLTVVIQRPGTDPARFRFSRVWAAEEERA